VKFDVPAAVGVPLTTPVEEARDNPAGRLPERTDQLYGVAPPVATIVWLYATPTVPLGRVVVVITRLAGMTIESAWSSVSGVPWLSVTRTVKFDVPAVVGVPLITPPELRDSPDGRLPESSDQLYGVTPPVAASVRLYATPICPFGRLVVVITRSGIPELMIMDNAWSSVSGVPWLSVTLTVKFDVPAVVGVPLIVPVEEPSDSPAGSDPEITDQLYGVVPPVATTVWLYATPICPFGRLVVVITRSAGPAAPSSGSAAIRAYLIFAVPEALDER
jgi:hypothetical protein